MSKKVAYITRHAVPNYGSALQTYATQAALENIGYEATCINYIHTSELPQNILKSRLNMSRWNKNFVTRMLYFATQKPVFHYASKKFSSYIEDIIKFTDKEYHTEDELKNDLPKADVYMTGSDQVWNTITYDKIDPAYFLSFVPDEKKKVAYAASFGGKTVKDQDKEQITKLISRYDSISIREDSGIDIARSLGIQAKQVLDPTFLIEQNSWLKIIPERKPKEKFVLVYQLHPNKEFEKYAKTFAKNKGLKLIRIHPYFHHFVKPGKFVCCPSLSEFLWHIKNAEYFLTDSFHGTAFATGLNTQFVDVLPKAYSERISSILQVIGCENRVLKSYDDFKIADTRINFDLVNAKIEVERKKSYEILKAMLED